LPPPDFSPLLPPDWLRPSRSSLSLSAIVFLLEHAAGYCRDGKQVIVRGLIYN
jgi:hypothetical protein